MVLLPHTIQILYFYYSINCKIIFHLIIIFSTLYDNYVKNQYHYYIGFTLTFNRMLIVLEIILYIHLLLSNRYFFNLFLMYLFYRKLNFLIHRLML